MSWKRFFAAASAALAIVIMTLVLTPGAWAAGKYKILYRFSGTDGASPQAGLIFDAAGNLYGTTASGGAFGAGTVFELSPGANGAWNEKVLYSFCAVKNCKDGANPSAGLIFDGAGNLYGETWAGGPIRGCWWKSGCGTVFQLAPGANGQWTETVLHSFEFTTGFYPNGVLIFDTSGNLYGTAGGGGDCRGTLFQLSPGADGQWTTTVLHLFGRTDWPPVGGVIFDAAGNLYGTTDGVNGPANYGGVYELTNGQWTETKLYTFHGGAVADGRLVFDAAGNLYGATTRISGSGYGFIFKLSPGSNGQWSKAVLHSFKGKDGGNPVAGLIFDLAGNLYGTTYNGGDQSCSGGCGIVYKLTPTKTWWAETILHYFRGKDGSAPAAGLILDQAGNLYGTTSAGGNLSDCSGTGCGVVFEITP